MWKIHFLFIDYQHIFLHIIKDPAESVLIQSWLLQFHQDNSICRSSSCALSNVTDTVINDSLLPVHAEQRVALFYACVLLLLLHRHEMKHAAEVSLLLEQCDRACGMSESPWRLILKTLKLILKQYQGKPCPWGLLSVMFSREELQTTFFAELRPLITLQIRAKNLEVICYYVGGQCKEERLDFTWQW